MTPPFDACTQNNGWKTKDGAWSDDNNGIPLADCVNQDVSPQASFFPVPHNSSLRPCLFVSFSLSAL